MGSGASRGKKVAPVCIGEVRRSEAGGAQQDTGLFNLRKAQCAKHRGPSEGPHRDTSVEDGDADGQRASVRKTSPRRIFIRSKTYRLCPFSREDDEDETSSSAQLEEPRVPRSVERDGNKWGDCAFSRRKPFTPAGFIQRHKFSAGGTILERVPTCDKQQTLGSCHSPSPPMPVILYDGSEEELMDTIEREFS